jgi:heme A synthase
LQEIGGAPFGSLLWLGSALVMMGGIAYAHLVIERNIRRLEMRKHVIAAATATMFAIATGAIVAGTGDAVAAETGTKTFPTSSVNPPPTPPPVWGDEPRGHYVYPRHVYYPRHHYHHHYRVMN